MSDQEDAALLQVGDASGNVNSSEDSKELSRMRWSWQLVLSILVLPVLFTFKPSEWFLVSYLEHQFNLTQTVVDTVVFPLWTYSFLGFTLLFTVLSAFQVPGKWCLVVALFFGALGSACLSLFPLAFGWVLGLVLASEVFVGMYSAGEVVFSSLLYRLVPNPAKFQHMASISRSMRLLGQATKGSSALLAQLLRYNGVSIGSLVYIGFSTLSAAFVLCLFLRFDWKKDPIWRKEASAVVLEPEKTFSSGWRESLLLYRMMEVQQFSLFLLVSNAIHPLVLTYTQSLIEDQQPSVVPYNAYLLSFATMMSCGCAVLPVLFLQRERLARARKVLLFAPAICAILLGFMSNYKSFLGQTVWPSYTALVLYQCVFEGSLVIASAALATHLCVTNLRQYGVLFCLAYSAAVGLQSLIQYALQQSNLPLRLYFVVMGASYMALPALLFGVWCIHRMLEAKK